MKTQNTVDNQAPSSSPTPHLKSISWLASLGAILTVTLLIAASVMVYAWLDQHHKGQSSTTTPPPPAGTWQQVLHGYTLSSLTAAQSDASVLYACATFTQPAVGNSNSGSTVNYTILRSADFGAHWHNVGSKAQLGYSCQLAINPTNSNDLYAVSIPDNGQAATSSLLHSINGGQTWSTIQATLNIPSVKTASLWNVQQLSMEDNALFGVQSLPQNTPPMMHPTPLPRAYARLSRLVTSTDGGHNWTVIDQQSTAAHQLITSYVVDPSNASTIYELLGAPWLPIQPAVAEPDLIPTYGSNGDLYKTTDGGATWHLLLQNLPFGTQLHLASDNPQLLYVGGSRTPLPEVGGAAIANVFAAFHLRVSRNGGDTWQDVPDLSHTSQEAYIQSWFVNSHGQAYAFPNSGSWFNGQPPAVTGTVVPTTPAPVPSTPPQSKSSSMSPGLSIITRPALTPPSVITSGPLTPIQRYDSISDTWHTVTIPPTYGTLLAVTSGGTNSTILWFMSINNKQSDLYRYVE